MKKLFDVNNLLKNSEFSTKIYVYMSTKSAGDDYDGYEANYVYTNLNPIIIKGYVREISSEALVWKQYGLHNVGAVEVICESKYRNYFEFSNKIIIDNAEYQVFKEGTGSKSLIQNRPYKLIRVILNRKP